MTERDANLSVDYGTLDEFKVEAQALAATTDGNIDRFGLNVVPWTRGESVFLIEHPDHHEAHVNEGLGTKNDAADALRQAMEVAEELEERTDRTFYENPPQCAVAMIVNDMVTLGALPTNVAMHLDVQDASWFKDKKRYRDLLRGWKKACDLARCVWGPGETASLRDLVVSGKIIMSGSAVGIVKPKERLIRRNIEHGDAMVFLASSGIHANGLTDARSIAKELPDGYLTRLSDGRTYGETLLDPTHIYVGFIEDALDAGIEIHYGVNITGHGFRKLMRAPETFTYHVDVLPPIPEVFQVIASHGNFAPYKMFGTFNMGVGFVLYVPPLSVEKLIALGGNRKYPFDIWDGGRIFESSKRRVILPNGITFEEKDMQLR